MKKLSIATISAAFVVLGSGGAAQAIVTADDPANHLVPDGQYTGVGSISQLSCNGSLLNGGLYVLSAAHCFTDSNGVFNNSLVGNTTITFQRSQTDSVPIAISDFFINPDWKGSFIEGNDIAVLKLAQPAPGDLQQYDIYRNTNEVGQNFTIVGHGSTGTGNTGATGGSGTKRFGQNRFDTLADVLINPNDNNPDPRPGNQLLFDFDNGTTTNDAAGVYFNRPDTGLGNNEVIVAAGDSGGPSFLSLNNAPVIAGISSYLLDIQPNPGTQRADIDTVPSNSTFGELASDTRVSFYANFVDAAVAGNIPSAAVPFEPSSWLGLLIWGVFGAFSWGQRKNKGSKGREF